MIARNSKKSFLCVGYSNSYLYGMLLKFFFPHTLLIFLLSVLFSLMIIGVLYVFWMRILFVQYMLIYLHVKY